MKLIKKIRQHRRDFHGLYQCEHCGHEQENRGGYDDRNYHENVIPAMACDSCGKTAPDGALHTTPDVPEWAVL